jgi:type IV pilus assembly protein PilB
MAAPRVRLGELLVEAQIITREQLDEVLALQRNDGRRLGTLLCETGLVTETQVTQILSQQLAVPWVSLYHIDFSRQLLNLVPRELAERHSLVPIFVRRVRGQGETLYLAMDNPEDESARQEVAQYAGLPVRAMIAPLSDIRAAIRVYYAAAEGEEIDQPATSRIGPTSDAPSQASEPAVKEPSAPPARVPSAPPKDAPTGFESAAKEISLPRDSAPPESGPAISAREISMPAPKRGPRGRIITVTLLDGTQINLPARKSEAPAVEGGDLTARDLVAALRAVSHGADATEVLGENARWEALFAALLSVLLRKHLIADWEFVEEYRKI